MEELDQVIETPEPATLNSPEIDTPAPEQPASEEPITPESTDGEPIVPPPYVPNFKVKAYDNEYDIPENFRSFMNKDNEKDFHSIFSKAFGLDGMKEKYTKTKENYEKVNTEHTQLKGTLSTISKYVANGDFDSFFRDTGIPEQAIQRWMLHKLQMRDLPPEQQRAYNDLQQQRERGYQMEAENERLKSESEGAKAEREQIAVTQRLAELDQVLHKPEFSQVASQYDARQGQPGAFRKSVIQQAQYIAQTQGKDLSAEEAVKEVLNFAKGFMPDTAESGEKVLPPRAGQKPTLPNVAGKTTSPVAQKVTSIDDLRKLRTAVLQSQSQ